MSIITDTLSCDTALVSKFRSSGDYDYYSQKLNPEWNKMSDHDGSMWGDWSFNFSPTLVTVFTVIFSILILAMIIFALYKAGVFKKKIKIEDEEEEQEGEFTIKNRDFSTLIEQAKAGGNWNEAVRLTFLNSLKFLSDRGIVSWEQHKTPTEYAVEAGNTPFRQLTNIFLRVRYGLFNADERQFLQAHDLGDQTMEAARQWKKGGES